jgi:AraC-like DNA-binding protein
VSLAISYARNLADAVERSGADVDAYLERAGLSRTRLLDPSARLDVGTYDRLMELALDMTGDSALGLHMGELASTAAYHVVGQIATQCRTMREAIEVALKFQRVVGDLPPSRIVEEGARCRFVPGFLRTTPRCNRVRTEFAITRLCLFGRIFAGSPAPLIEVWFEHGKPTYAAEYRRIFDGRERFDMPETAIVFDREVLDRPQLHPDPGIQSALEERAEEVLRRLDRRSTFAERVRELIELGARSGLPTLDEVARELRVSPRSLRRRLEMEGTSFAALMASVRGEVARKILAETTTTIQEAAFQMGFADVSSFYRAFRRWTGMTPVVYRESLDR